jgi:membrane-associated phospholipid phosphatase
LRKAQIYIVFCFVLDIFILPVKPYAQNIDIDILKSINPRYPTSQYWIQTSSSAYWVPATFVVGSLAYGFIAHDYKEKVRGFQSLISVGTAIAFTEILKPIVHRTRPGDAYPNEIFPNSITHGSSFPSGHTTLAFATATTIALEYKRWWITIPAYLWAASVGYSRMYLGKHYPSDVLAGAVIGVGGAYLGRLLTRKIFKDKHLLKTQ